MKHELKIRPEYLSAVHSGEKTFEIRNNADRNFQVGDTLLIKAWDGEFTGDFVEKVVSYITDFEQKPGYVVLGLVNHREHELLEKFHRTGVAIERSISTGSVLSDRPLKSRLELLANHHKREQARADGMVAMADRCKLLADLLREVTQIVPAIGVAIDDLPAVDAFLERIEAVLAGKLPVPAVTVTETIRTAPDRIWLQVGDQSHYHSEPFPSDTEEVTWCADSVVGCEVPYVRADLVGHAPTTPKPEGQS
ncbi:ASCH/PUA domain-containing protein [Aeromonas hydrophila]|uniref:ASCH/PUA domain-containing protein n=1 Tax=Aeromonas hydrophila TaxID=644 RepID=UPI00235F6860|nr:ASCH/PUA domain-containing protein [Aeromonas hydrophila]